MLDKLALSDYVFLIDDCNAHTVNYKDFCVVDDFLYKSENFVEDLLEHISEPMKLCDLQVPYVRASQDNC